MKAIGNLVVLDERTFLTSFTTNFVHVISSEPLQNIDNDQVTQKLISESKRQLPDTASVLIKGTCINQLDNLTMGYCLLFTCIN